ncbi:MAG: hypothetical protein V2A56_09015 [bacterium]
MHPKDVRKIVRIPGVRNASFVGLDGQIVVHEGRVPPLLHAQLTRAWNIISNGNLATAVPSLQEIHWEGGILLIVPTLGGLIVIETDRIANVGMLRLELEPLRMHLDSAFRAEQSIGGEAS